MTVGTVILRALDRVLERVVLMCFTCPALTVMTVVLRALDRVRERALGCFARSPKSPPARRHVGTRKR